MQHIKNKINCSGHFFFVHVDFLVCTFISILLREQGEEKEKRRPGGAKLAPAERRRRRQMEVWSSQQRFSKEEPRSLRLSCRSSQLLLSQENPPVIVHTDEHNKPRGWTQRWEVV